MNGSLIGLSSWGVGALAAAGAAAAAALGLALVLRRKRALAAADAAPGAAAASAGPVVLVAPLEADPEGDAQLRIVDALTRRLGGRASIVRGTASPFKGGRREEDAARRARSLGEKARAALVIWGTAERGAARLRLLAAGASGPEAYSFPAALPAPFDAALAAAAAAVGLGAPALADLEETLSATMAELSAALSAAPVADADDAARMRAVLARASLALFALRRDPAWARAALEATAPPDPRWTAEPLEWAEVQAMRGRAIALKIAKAAEPSRADLGERVDVCRAAFDMWTEKETPCRIGRAEIELAEALVDLADRDGDLRGVEEAGRLMEGALHRANGAAETDPDATARSAILGAARLRLGEREPRPARLEAAERDLRRALVLADAAGDAERASRIKLELARALSRLGERDRGSERLRAAAVIYRVCLEENGRDALAGAQARASLGRTLVHVGERDRDAAAVDEAVAALRMAAHAFAACGAAAAAAQTRRALERAERLHASLRAARA